MIYNIESKEVCNQNYHLDSKLVREHMKVYDTLENLGKRGFILCFHWPYTRKWSIYYEFY